VTVTERTDEDTGRPGRRTGGLVRYVVAAALVRGADSGATVGLILLAIAQVRNGAAAGGLLAATLSAPHLVGPWTAHRLDRAHDGRRLLAGAYLVYAVALAAGATAVGRAPIAVALGAVAVAGCCGPLLTGGLSSRLAAIARPAVRAQRRAQGWDALTYSIGGTAGPALVAGLAALSGPLTAVLGLSVAAAAGAVLTITLPRHHAPGDRLEDAARAPGVRDGLVRLVAHPSLRRVTTMTMLSALELGALPVIAAIFGSGLTGRPGAGAALTVAFGVGGLAGALFVTAFPLRGEPERLALHLFATTATVTALCAFAPAYGFALAGFAVIGLVNAAAFTATLAARTKYAPPHARAQVFVTSAGLKVALASVGAAATGMAAGLGGRVLLLLAAAITATSVLAAIADRVLDRRRADVKKTPGGAP
jgi:hypothetical protein